MSLGTGLRARTPEMVSSAGLAARRPSASPRVLAVDDDPIIRELVKLHLSNAGYDVVVAEDAIAAGKMLLESKPALLLVDVDMPFMDGFEFVAAIKGDPDYRSIPVVFLTGHDNAEKRAAELGAIRCLRKPIFSQQLISALGAIVPVRDPEVPAARTMGSRIVTAVIRAVT